MLIVNNVANVSTNIYQNFKQIGKDVSFYQPLTNANCSNRFLLLIHRTLLPFIIWYKALGHKSIYIHYAYFASLIWFTKKDVIVHCHGTDLRENLNNEYRRVTLKALSRAKVILYATPDLRQYIPNEFLHKSLFIPNPVDLKEFYPLKKSREHEKLKIFFISKFDRTKGVDKFLPLVDYLCRQPEVAKVTLFKHGNAMPVEMPNHNKLMILERVSYEDMPKIMRQHDIAIGQMQLGAIGMSELESMACGLPTIAYFNYNFEYEKPSPILSPESFNEAQQYLQELIDSEQMRNEISHESRIWVEKFHEIGRISAHLIDAFERRDIRF